MDAEIDAEADEYHREGDRDQVELAHNALKKWQTVFIKASSQGSSVGCYQVNDASVLVQHLQQAFSYSPYDD